MSDFEKKKEEKNKQQQEAINEEYKKTSKEQCAEGIIAFKIGISF